MTALFKADDQPYAGAAVGGAAGAAGGVALGRRARTPMQEARGRMSRLSQAARTYVPDAMETLGHVRNGDMSAHQAVGHALRVGRVVREKEASAASAARKSRMLTHGSAGLAAGAVLGGAVGAAALHHKQAQQPVVKRVLTAEDRKKLPKKDFAGGGRSYPIPDESHARLALAMVSRYGSPQQVRNVRRRVRRKFPNIDVSGGSSS